MTDDTEKNAPDKGPTYRGGLDFSPQIASALGAYVAEFANLEMVMEIVFNDMLQATVPIDSRRPFANGIHPASSAWHI